MALDLTELKNFKISDLEIEPSGKPLEIDISDIIEDPHQPRKYFPEESLRELADSIKDKGVKSPISLKPKNSEGKYILNYGARRLKASILAGKQTIPAFIDEEHDDYDQMHENLQRDNLTALEIAWFIERKIKDGEKKGDIAKRLNKHISFITIHAALLKADECIVSLCDKGKCTDARALYGLSQAHEKFPQLVESFIDNNDTITRSEVNSFVSTLAVKDDKSKVDEPENSKSEKNASSKVDETVSTSHDQKIDKISGTEKNGKLKKKSDVTVKTPDIVAKEISTSNTISCPQCGHVLELPEGR